jgi:hypothetical protein
VFAAFIFLFGPVFFVIGVYVRLLLINQHKLIQKMNVSNRQHQDTTRFHLILSIQEGNLTHCASCGASRRIRLNIPGSGEQPQCKTCNAPSSLIMAAAKTRIALMVRKERRVTFMMGGTFASFIVCCLPLSTLHMINCFANRVISPTAMIAGIWLTFCHSAVNPIMYFICNPDFRKAF